MNHANDNLILRSGSLFKIKPNRFGAFASSTHRKKITKKSEDGSHSKLSSPASAAVANGGSADEFEDDDNSDEGNEYAALSLLKADTVRWLNKHKIVKGPRAPLYKYHTTLASALPYKPIFVGLDTAEEGDIELKDIEDVIKKLSKPRPGEPALFGDPKAILNFFREMDTDGGGTVDFGEFAIGMTNCPGGKDGQGVVRLQDAFMKYSSDIQRTAILNKATNTKDSDLDRFNAMKKLFEVPYAGHAEERGVNTEDIIREEYRRYDLTNRSIKGLRNEERIVERDRSRAAKVFFEYDKKRTDPLSTHGSSGKGKGRYISGPLTRGEVQASYLSHPGLAATVAEPVFSMTDTTAGTSANVLERSSERSWRRHRTSAIGDALVADMRDPDQVLRKVTKRLSQKLRTFPLADRYRKHAEGIELLLPLAGGVVNTSPPPSNTHLREMAIKDARRVRYGSTTLLPPPLSSPPTPLALSPLRSYSVSPSALNMSPSSWSSPLSMR